jgi:hypothetical protein
MNIGIDATIQLQSQPQFFVVIETRPIGPSNLFLVQTALSGTISIVG